MLTTHNFTTDERPAPSSAWQEWREELAAWAVVALMAAAVGAGVLVDRTVCCAVATVAAADNASAVSYANGYQRWRNDALARRIAASSPAPASADAVKDEDAASEP